MYLAKTLPQCNFCGKEARWDAPTLRGSWAYVCVECMPNVCNPDTVATVGTEFILDERTKEDVLYDAVREAEYVNSLTDDDLEEMFFDGVVETADGCSVEPDGKCPHGYSSPLRVKGLI
jgi:hypothetical protein